MFLVPLATTVFFLKKKIVQYIKNSSCTWLMYNQMKNNFKNKILLNSIACMTWIVGVMG